MDTRVGVWRLPSSVAALCGCGIPESARRPRDSMTHMTDVEAFYRERHTQDAHKQRPERQRDVLFGAGCGLLCFGLFPYSASASIVSDTLDRGDSSTPTGFLADEFDATTRLLSLVFSVLGLACVTLSCVVVSRWKLRVALVTVLFPLFACVALSSVTIFQYSTVDDVVNVLRHTRVVTQDQEMRLERSVNALFCETQALDMCQMEEWFRGRSAFGLDAPEKTCEELERTEEAYPVDMDMTKLISDPSREVLLWCGQYVAHEEPDIADSPYQQYRIEVLDHLLRALAWRQARVKLLMVLEWFGAPALLAVIWWLGCPSNKVRSTSRLSDSSIVHIVV